MKNFYLDIYNLFNKLTSVVNCFAMKKLIKSSTINWFRNVLGFKNLLPDPPEESDAKPCYGDEGSINQNEPSSSISDPPLYNRHISSKH